MAQQIAYGYRNILNLAPGSVVCMFSPNSFYYRSSLLLQVARKIQGC
jgi:hypothetical protein